MSGRPHKRKGERGLNVRRGVNPLDGAKGKLPPEIYTALDTALNGNRAERRALNGRPRRSAAKRAFRGLAVGGRHV